MPCRVQVSFSFHLVSQVGFQRLRHCQLYILDEIKPWIMSLGPEAYIEEPESLRDMVKADLKKAMTQYEGIRPTFQKPAVLEKRVDYARQSEHFSGLEM